MKFFILSICLLFSVVSFGQNIQKEIKSIKYATEQYVNAIPKDAQKYKPLAAEGYQRLADIYQSQHDFKSEKKYLLASRNLYNEMALIDSNYLFPLSLVKLKFGELIYALGDIKKAKIEFESVLPIFSSLKNEEERGEYTSIVLSDLSYVYESEKDFKRACNLFGASIQISEKNKTLSILDKCENNIRLIILYKGAKDYPTVTRLLEEEIELLLNSSLSDKKRRIGYNYGSLGWYQILNQEYEKSEKSSKKGIGLIKKNWWIEANLALAYLMQGKYDLAKPIYLKYLNSDLEGTGRGIFLEDISQLEEMGITHPDFEKIKQLLKS